MTNGMAGPRRMKAAAVLMSCLVMAACRRPPTVNVNIGDEAQEVVIAEGTISDRTFSPANPDSPAHRMVGRVAFTMEVASAEPPDALPWLGESIVFEKPTSRSDAVVFIGDRIRVMLDPSRSRRATAWQGLRVDLVEPAPRPPCPNGARAGTIEVPNAPPLTSPAEGQALVEGRVVKRYFMNVQKVPAGHQGYDPLDRIVFIVDVTDSVPEAVSSEIVPPFRVSRSTRPSDLEIREGDIVRVVFNLRPGVLEVPAKLAIGREIVLLRRACGEGDEV